MTPRARIARAIVALAFAGLFTAACKDTSGPDTLATLTITPASATLAPNGVQDFSAAGTRSGGDPVTLKGEVWAVVNGGGTINATTGVFTAGTVPGTFTNTVRVTCGGLTSFATVIVNAGAPATIVVAPDTTLVVGATAQFRAVVRDAFNNIITPTLVWSVINPVAGNLAGTIIPTTGLFTAGNTIGTFPNSVQACVGTTTLCDQANVTVTPPAISGFTVLARTAVTCTDGNIIGDVGTFQGPSPEAPPGSITQTTCPITVGTAQVGTPAAKTAFNNFVTTYNSLATATCGTTLSGNLGGMNLVPGVYCVTAGTTSTGTLTLTGTSTDRWLFKIGTGGTGALTGTSFTVTMAGTSQACNVTWWVRQAATMTDSFFKGSVLAGAAISLTRGNFNGNAWAGADAAVAGDVTITGPLTPPGVTGCP